MAKIGIMSFAHMHAYGYAACLNELADTELVSVWDNDPKRGKTAAGQFGATFIKSLDKFLASRIDAVIITSENTKHRQMVEAATAAGKWILCEKPLATTLEDCQAMIDACKRAGVGLGTAFPCRYVPSIIAVKKQIDNGDFGEILAASCTNNGKFPGGWFGKRALAGGGATMDHTVHVADLLRWMLGKEFVKVHCENGRLHGRDTDLDDCGCLQMTMEGGTIVSHIASWNRCASFPTWGDVTMQIIGTKGVVDVDVFNQKVNVYNDDALRAEWAGWGDNADLGLLGDFVAAVDARREPPITGEDGMKAVAVTLAAYKSAETGSTVAV